MNKAVFLDRDGVLNEERGDYSWLKEHIVIPPDLKQGLEELKSNGFLLIVITNQGGIAKGIYSSKEVYNVFQIIQEAVGGALDAHYYSPYHPSAGKSLSRKPEPLMLERAIARFDVDVSRSWMIGDSERDIQAASAVGVKGMLIASERTTTKADAQNFSEAVSKILDASAS